MKPLDAVKVLKKGKTLPTRDKILREHNKAMHKILATTAALRFIDEQNDISIPKLRKVKVEKDYTPYLILIGLAIIFAIAAFQGLLSGEQLIR